MVQFLIPTQLNAGPEFPEQPMVEVLTQSKEWAEF
jgi:hypothetical protein